MPWLIIVLGYLLGSVPAAYIAGRIVKGVDIRQVGDENAGAANAFRQLSPLAGIIVAIFDVGKGILVVLIARAADMSQAVVLLTGLAAVMGHNYPLYIGFRGGRGLSTTIGVLTAIITQAMLISAVPALLTFALRKDITAASAALFILLPLVGWWLEVPGLLILYGIGLPCIVGLTHFLRIRKKLLRRA